MYTMKLSNVSTSIKSCIFNSNNGINFGNTPHDISSLDTATVCSVQVDVRENCITFHGNSWSNFNYSFGVFEYNKAYVGQLIRRKV